MTIPGSSPFASAPYGAVPVVPVVGPEGGPYNVTGPRTENLLPFAARVGTTQTAVQTNYGYRGVYLSLAVASGPGGGETLTITIRGVDSLGGATWDILTVPASATPGGVCCLYPGLSGGAVEGVPVTRNLPLPQQWYVIVTHSGAGSWNYSLSAELMP